MTDNHFLILLKNKIWIIKRSKIQIYNNQSSLNLKDYLIDDKVGIIDLNILFEGPITSMSGINILHVRH
jgi:hypothetical protein